MKLPLLLCLFTIGLSSRALAQSTSPTPVPSYFGSQDPSGVGAAPTTPGAPDASPPRAKHEGKHRKNEEIPVSTPDAAAPTPADSDGSTSKKVTVRKEPDIVGPGLTLYRYATQPTQIGATKYNGYVPVADLLKQKPAQPPRTVDALGKWKKAEDENAVLTGFIKIDKPGTYGFRTNSGYDRNELLVNGRVVCKFRDGENQGQSVELPVGTLSITSVGYVRATTEINVQWLPPGATTWTDVPSKLLYHERATASQ